MPSNHLILCHPCLLCPQSFPPSESFPMSWLFESGSQSIGVSASALVLAINIQGWFPLGFTGLIFLLSKGLSRIFCSTQFKSISSLVLSLLYGPTLTSLHDYCKTIALTIQTFVGKVTSLLFNMLSRFVIAFLPRIKCLLILWLQSLPTVILDPKKTIFVTISLFSLSVCHEVMGLDAMILVFWMLSFNTAFHSPLSPSSRGCLVPLPFLPLKWYHLHIWGCWYISCQSWFQLVSHPAQHFTWCTLNRS